MIAKYLLCQRVRLTPMIFLRSVCSDMKEKCMKRSTKRAKVTR